MTGCKPWACHPGISSGFWRCFWLTSNEKLMELIPAENSFFPSTTWVSKVYGSQILTILWRKSWAVSNIQFKEMVQLLKYLPLHQGSYSVLDQWQSEGGVDLGGQQCWKWDKELILIQSLKKAYTKNGSITSKCTYSLWRGRRTALAVGNWI